jgi:hypothetical protein
MQARVVGEGILQGCKQALLLGLEIVRLHGHICDASTWRHSCDICRQHLPCMRTPRKGLQVLAGMYLQAAEAQQLAGLMCQGADSGGRL